MKQHDRYATMLEAATRIYVRDPEQADDLVPAVVQEILGEKIMLRFLQPVSFASGAKTTAFFHNKSNCFTSVPCQIHRMFSKGRYPTAAIIVNGKAEVAESRSAYRVDINDQTVTATINGEHHGEAANMSCGGIALLLDQEGYKNEEWLDVALVYESGEFRGKMQVRSQSKDLDGRFRYGLMADPQDTDLISQLTRISQEIQARAEALNVETEKQESKAKEEEEKRLQRPGPKREHQRTPWTGKAKVYLREEHNLRVLSVDTADLSRGGISFISPQYIYEGSEALYEKPISGGFFRVMIEIRNVQIVEYGHHIGQHRIGAMFLGTPMKGGAIPEKFDATKAA
ncbi:MAG: PilZ domain-containing protein [Phycisphaeraceae bacterium]